MTTTSADSNETQDEHIYSGPHETMGQYLQRARIEQEKTLDSVAEATCIHIATIKALEEDDYEKLPAEVFVRGFIKIYATLLKLDPDKALSLYQPAPGPDTEDFSGMKGTRQRILPGETLAEASPFTAGRQFLIFLLLLAVAFFIYKAFLSDPEPEVMMERTTGENSVVVEPGQLSPLPTEPTAPVDIHPDGGQAGPETNSEPEQIDKTLAAEAAAVVDSQPPAPAASAPAEATVPLQEEVAPPPVAEEEHALLTPPTPHQERLIIEPHRRKTIRKQPQPVATVTETPTTSGEDSQLAADATASTETVAESPASPTPAEPEAAATTPAPAGQDTVVEAAASTEASTKPTPYAYILKANFTDLTWLEVVVDNGPQHDYTFRAGEQWEWRANKEIQLHVGNAGGVNLRLNNTPLPSLGETGKSVRITLPTEPQ